MKAILVLTAIVGLTSAQGLFGIASPKLGTSDQLLNPGTITQSIPIIKSVPGLDKLDLSSLDEIKALYKNYAAFGKGILKHFSSIFLANFKNDLSLLGMPEDEVIENFLTNAEKILTLADNPNHTFKLGLDNPLLGWSEKFYKNILTFKPDEEGEDEDGADDDGKEDDGKEDDGKEDDGKEDDGADDDGEDDVSNPRVRRQAGDVPESIDWREKGALTPIKNQGQCGSCWAFATIGAIEGRIGAKTGKPPVLSEQNLIDCAKNDGEKPRCKGCRGGNLACGYHYAITNGGIDTVAAYPFEMSTTSQNCRYDPAGKASDVTVADYKEVAAGDEEDLKKAVAEGPVAVGVDADGWQSYKSGIYNKHTSSGNTNHAVVIVGYGTEAGQDYWIVRNSHGEDWGEKGYIRVARNKGNIVSIASQAKYPLVA